MLALLALLCAPNLTKPPRTGLAQPRPRHPKIMSFRGVRGMAFVRGESSDSATKGDKYMWAPGPDRQTAAMRGLKRAADDDAYFDEPEESAGGAAAADADDDDPLEAYMRELEGKPAPSKKPKATAPKPALPPPKKPAAAAAEEEEEDSLDAYMADLAKKPAPAAAPAKPARFTKQLDEQEDHVSDFMEKQQAEGEGEDGAAGDDKEAGGAGPRRQLKDQKGKVDALAAVDHEAVEYAPFNKDFYTVAQSVKEMTEEEVAAYRRRLNVRCSGFDVPRPLQRFDQARAHSARSRPVVLRAPLSALDLRRAP